MLAAPPPPPPVQQVERDYAAMSQRGLFELLDKQAKHFPQAAFQYAHLLTNEERRDRILRQAFATAATRDREAARQHIAAVIDRPWLGDISFFDALAIASMLVKDSQVYARKLLLAASVKNPSAALRELRSYIGMPFGQEVFEEAALFAPDEAASLASGSSSLASDLLSALRASELPEVKILAELAANRRLDQPTRAAVAVFSRQMVRGELSLARAIRIAGSSSTYFVTLARIRISASGKEAQFFDRVLENYSQTLLRAFQQAKAPARQVQMRKLSAPDLYLLLTYGRTEEDAKLFSVIFDDFLMPKLRKKAGGLAQLLHETRSLNLRTFVSMAIFHHRLDTFLAMAGSSSEQARLLARCMNDIDKSEQPLEQTVLAAEIIDNTARPETWKRLKEAVQSAYQRSRQAGDAKAQTMYGLLAARLVQKPPARELPPDDPFRRIAKLYRPYFKAPDRLDASSLFNEAGNTCIERYFFYNDDDGVESFDSFRLSYASDPAWRIEDHGWYVRITGKSRGRRIEIYANVPVDLGKAENAAKAEEANSRQHALAKLLSENGLEPSVIVHRGHSYHVAKTLAYLTKSAQIVFLGSCRGMHEVDSVIESAANAQIIVTRGTGSLTVNDPFLKALNDYLLGGVSSVEWAAFWKSQKPRLGNNGLFEDYVPPYRNSAAILLAAYHDFLADDPQTADRADQH
jgi:hypothetical protein